MTFLSGLASTLGLGGAGAVMAAAAQQGAVSSNAVMAMSEEEACAAVSRAPVFRTLVPAAGAYTRSR